MASSPGLQEKLLEGHDAAGADDKPGLEEKEEDSVPPPSLLLFIRALYLLTSVSAASWGRLGAIYYAEKGLSALWVSCALVNTSVRRTL